MTNINPGHANGMMALANLHVGPWIYLVPVALAIVMLIGIAAMIDHDVPKTDQILRSIPQAQHQVAQTGQVDRVRVRVV